jgi:beta-glucosidase-like glycosyl hydrolase
MIVSDCGAIAGIGPAQHNFTGPASFTAAGLRGGTDVYCGSWCSDRLDADLAADVADVDRALNRTMTQLIRLGLADGAPPAPWDQLTAADIDAPAARKLALDAATQGFVLLRNEGALLPLRPKQRGGKVRRISSWPKSWANFSLF